MQKKQWQVYQELELIPHFVSEPQAKQPILTLPLRAFWRSLINLLSEELVYEQQVEHLEKCLAASELKFTDANHTNTWQQFWTLMN
jgi:hypothetical protein